MLVIIRDTRDKCPTAERIIIHWNSPPTNMPVFTRILDQHLALSSCLSKHPSGVSLVDISFTPLPFPLFLSLCTCRTWAPDGSGSANLPPAPPYFLVGPLSRQLDSPTSPPPHPLSSFIRASYLKHRHTAAYASRVRARDVYRFRRRKVRIVGRKRGRGWMGKAVIRSYILLSPFPGRRMCCWLMFL